MRKHILPLLGMLALNLVPLAGVLLLDWSILEVVAYVWLEAAVLVVFAAVRTAVLKRWVALLVVPPFLLAMAGLLFVQILFLTLAFFVMRFQEGIFEVAAEGQRVARGILWGLGLVVAWHAVGLAVWLPRREGTRARLVLLSAAAHVLVLMVFSILSVYVMRDLRAPTLALGLLVVMKTGVDAGAYGLEQWLQARPWSQQSR